MELKKNDYHINPEKRLINKQYYTMKKIFYNTHMIGNTKFISFILYIIDKNDK